jgi:N utilization substance protein A
MEVVVPDDQLSLAIGKRGQNVRLASKLSGWNLDVTSESNYNTALKQAYDSLLNLEGVGEKTASNLYQQGFRSAGDVAKTAVAELAQVEGISEEKAERLIANALEFMESEQAAVEAEEGVKSDDELKEDVSDGEGESP